MTDTEIVEAMRDAWRKQNHVSQCDTTAMKAALAVATPEIERRLLRDMVRWAGIGRATFTSELKTFAKEHGISLEDE